MPPDNAVNDPEARHDGWLTIARFLPYLWPKDNSALRWRISIAVVLIVCAKATTLALPFFYKRAVDSMSLEGQQPLLIVTFAFVLAYALTLAIVGIVGTVVIWHDSFVQIAAVVAGWAVLLAAAGVVTVALTGEVPAADADAAFEIEIA